MIKTTTKDGKTYAKVADLRNWEDNPKDVMQDDMARLQEQIKMGEHSTLLVTDDGEVLGGNTRLRAYKKLGKDTAKVVIVSFDTREDGVHATIDGVEAEKVFSSVEQAKLEYALSHNDMIGAYNEGKLAELLHVTPIEMNLFKVPSVVRPVEDIAFEVGDVSIEDRDTDVDTTGDKLDTFLNGSIKQIVLYFNNDQYESIIPRLEALRQYFGVDNNTDLFLELLDCAEAHKEG